MSTDHQDRAGPRLTWLLALPMLCCAGHAVLLTLGSGSITTAVGGTTGRALLTAIGAVVVAAGVALVRDRRTR